MIAVVRQDRGTGRPVENGSRSPSGVVAPAVLTVGEVAALLGVSVRTLHHWDSIGLVRPSRRSWQGYRLYSVKDQRRLEQVLLYRQTGMPLALIRQVLDAPDADVLAYLTQQREQLEERVSRLTRMVRVIDTMLERIMLERIMLERMRTVSADDSVGGTAAAPCSAAHAPVSAELAPAELVELWKDFWGPAWDPAYTQEAEWRWGSTVEWAETTRRQRCMTRAAWEAARDQAEALEADLADAMHRGVVPGSLEADALAERYRANLSTWFEVSVSQQVLVVRLYETDDRLRSHYDHRAPGLATWLRKVVEAFARNQGVNPDTARWR